MSGHPGSAGKQVGKPSAGTPTWLSTRVSNALGQRTRDVLYWEDAKISGGCLGAGIIVFFLKMWCRYSWVTMFAGFIMVHMFLSMLRAGFYNFQQSVKDSAKHFEIDIRTSKESLEHFANQYNAWVDWYFEIAAGRDLRKSLWVVFLPVLGYSLIVCMLTYFLSDNVQAFLGFLIAFSFPKVYELKHELIDENVANIMSQIQTYTDQAWEMIPKAAKKNEPMKTQ